MIWNRLITEQEIQSLLSQNLDSEYRNSAPILDIVKFLLYTGCRRGEALHAEWEDFDLVKGIWNIRHKPKCPTKSGLGWSPKWHKERTVYLFDEAIKVLKNLPNHDKVCGSVGAR